MATAYDVIQVSIRTNDTEHPEVQVECEMDWNISRVKRQIEITHPKHYSTETQVGILKFQISIFTIITD